MLKRLWALCTIVVIAMACSLPAFAALELPLSNNGQMILNDGAGLLSDEEEKELSDYGRQIAEETGLVVFVRTTDNAQGKEIRRYLADEYESAGFDDSMPSIMLGIDMGQRELAVVTSTVSKEYYPVDVTNEMVDDVTSYLSDGEYARAVERFLDDAHYEIVNYGVKPVGTIVLISLGAGVVLALIVVGIMLYAHPRIANSGVSASHYLEDSRAQIYNHQDRFVSTHTTRRTIESNKDSGGASGGSFSSSSGGSYSGSSGKF